MSLAPVLVLLACSGRSLDAPDPLEASLVEVETLFAGRVQQENLDEAIELGWALLDESPEDPRVLEVLSRAYAARGYGHSTEDALEDLDQAYRLSRRCLARNPGWRSRLEVAGGRVVADVAARLQPTDAACLDTTMLSLGLRIQARGPAGWVDLRELDVLASAALTLDAEQARWVPPWATGLVVTIPPQDPEEAREEGAASLREATRREPELITATVDRLVYVQARDGDRTSLVRAINSVRQRRSTVRQDHPWALENRRGLERLEALLDETGP